MKFSQFPFPSPSLLVAFGEIFVILGLAAVGGFLLAKSVAKRKTHYLLGLIEEKKYELSQLRIQAKNEMNQPIATNASKTVYPITSPDHEPDDLKLIDGIGPKIEELLNAEGIHTYEQLAETPTLRIVGILKKAGPRFQLNDPSSWTMQAELAKAKKWEELSAYKQRLSTGQL